jgi:hypothetical protein
MSFIPSAQSSIIKEEIKERLVFNLSVFNNLNLNLNDLFNFIKILIFLYLGFSFGDLLFSIVNNEWYTNFLYSILVAFLNSFSLIFYFKSNGNTYGVFLVLSSYLIGLTIWLILQNIGVNFISYSIGLFIYILILVCYYYYKLVYPYSNS